MARGATIIVGVGPGLGVALAERFGREGRKVGLVARRAGELEGHRRALAERGVEAVAAAGDAGDEASLRGAVERAAADLGEVETLVYNAFAPRQGRPSKLDPKALVDDFRVNVAGALVAAQAVLPALRARGGGAILFTGGGLALDPYPDFASVAVGKAGIRNLALSLAKELAPENIHVATVTICGFIKEGTPFAPAAIADAYAELAAEPKDAWRAELVFRGG
ncbi:MAG TPA: SDR family NAD(P)-dependent oxidoreductase [Polyangiaceae bacterium]|nr:SDR family NAD(P)-dependent oxidoreductase [Polyangiaceae bacterium]